MTNKEASDKHEKEIAELYGGDQTKNSGQTVRDKGDVRVRSANTVFECKTTGEPGDVKHARIVTLLEKTADEAWAESREPALAMRWYNPESIFANDEGYVDVVVRLARDDALREQTRQSAIEDIQDYLRWP